jgi:hypothetical protein
MKTLRVCVISVLFAGCATLSQPQGGEPAVRAIDEQQRAMVAASDVAGLERLAHEALRINAPGGRILTRATFLANMRNGEIAAEQFQRSS